MLKIFVSFLIAFSFINGSAAEYKMLGTYLLEYSIFKIDIYQISYFKYGTSEKLVLDYKTGVEKKYSLEGWKVGLKHKLDQKVYQDKAQWLFDHTVDVSSGDKLIILRNNDEIEIFKNEVLVGKIKDEAIAMLAYEPWLGDKPVSEELKKALLSNEG